MKDAKTKDLISEFFKLEKEYWQFSNKFDEILNEIEESQFCIEMEIRSRKDLTQAQKNKLRKNGVWL